jgi:hypothetical protein
MCRKSALDLRGMPAFAGMTVFCLKFTAYYRRTSPASQASGHPLAPSSRAAAQGGAAIHSPAPGLNCAVKLAPSLQ